MGFLAIRCCFNSSLPAAAVTEPCYCKNQLVPLLVVGSAPSEDSVRGEAPRSPALRRWAALELAHTSKTSPGACSGSAAVMQGSGDISPPGLAPSALRTRTDPPRLSAHRAPAWAAPSPGTGNPRAPGAAPVGAVRWVSREPPHSGDRGCGRAVLPGRVRTGALSTCQQQPTRPFV